MNAKRLMIQLALGTVVMAGLAACNQNFPNVLDFGDVIVDDAGAVVSKIPGVTPIGDPVDEAIPIIKWELPSSFPKACNTSANIVQNPKFMVSTGSGNIPPATIPPWQQAWGTPQLSLMMGHGNPKFVQMWGFLDGGEAIRQTVGVMSGSYDVYFSAKQFNIASNPLPLRIHLKTSAGLTNPWIAPDINIPAPSTTWTMYGPITITPPSGADTITVASSNLTPFAQAEPKTVSWGQVDNVCILRKVVEPEPADVSITKALEMPAVAGQPNYYLLNVNNAGPGATTGTTVVTDVLPAGVTYNPSIVPPAGWTCNTLSLPTITCQTNAPMPPNTSVQLVIPVMINQDQGIITNCASVTAPNDPKPQNNQYCIESEVQQPKPFDLEIKKDLKTKPAVAGQPNSFVLTVTNLGPNSSSAPVTVTDTLPPGVTYNPSALVPAGWSCTFVAPTLTCQTLTPMPFPSNAQIVIPVTVNQQQGVLENCATVAAVGDTNIQNDRSCVATDVVPAKPIDIAIRKQLLGATSLPAGGIGTYKLNILNLGGAISAGPTVVIDNMPIGLTLLTASIVATPAADWNCAASTTTQLNCTYAGSYSIATGYSSSLQFDVQVAGGFIGSVKNCAKISLASDTVPSNNVSCIKNPIKNQVISDPFELALSDAMTQLEDYLETSPDEATAIQRATSGLKDTLKTQVRLMPNLTLEPTGTDPDTFNAIFQGDAGTSPTLLSVRIKCWVSYPPLQAGCTITITL